MSQIDEPTGGQKANATDEQAAAQELLRASLCRITAKLIEMAEAGNAKVALDLFHWGMSEGRSPELVPDELFDAADGVEAIGKLQMQFVPARSL